MRDGVCGTDGVKEDGLKHLGISAFSVYSMCYTVALFQYRALQCVRVVSVRLLKEMSKQRKPHLCPKLVLM